MIGQIPKIVDACLRAEEHFGMQERPAASGSGLKYPDVFCRNLQERPTIGQTSFRFNILERLASGNRAVAFESKQVCLEGTPELKSTFSIPDSTLDAETITNSFSLVRPAIGNVLRTRTMGTNVLGLMATPNEGEGGNYDHQSSSADCHCAIPRCALQQSQTAADRGSKTEGKAH